MLSMIHSLDGQGVGRFTNSKCECFMKVVPQHTPVILDRNPKNVFSIQHDAEN